METLPSAFVQVRLQHVAMGANVLLGAQVRQLGDEGDRLYETVQTLTGQARYFDGRNIPAELLELYTLLKEFVLNLVLKVFNISMV